MYTAENVLTPEVIQTIYTQRKQLNHLAVRDRTFDDFCFKVPILKFPEEGLLACNGKKKETESKYAFAQHDKRGFRIRLDPDKASIGKCNKAESLSGCHEC